MFPLIVTGLIFTSCIPAEVQGPTLERIKKNDLVSQEAAEPDPPKEDPKPDGTITAYTADWCVPCQRWKSECVTDLRAAGWEVIVIETNTGQVPRFTAQTGGRVRSWIGYGSRDGFIARLRDLVK